MERALKWVAHWTLIIFIPREQILLLGGSTRLPTLTEKLRNIFPETTSFTAQIDSDEVVAKGSALQALSLLNTYAITAPGSLELRQKATSLPALLNPSVTSAPIGLLVDKVFITLIEPSTPLPARRIFEVNVAPGGSEVVLELYEGARSIVSSKKEKVVKSKGSLFARAAAAISNGDADDDDEEDEDEEIKSIVIAPKSALAHLIVGVDSKVIKAIKGVPKVKVTIIVEDRAGQVVGSIAAVQVLEGAVEARAEF